METDKFKEWRERHAAHNGVSWVHLNPCSPLELFAIYCHDEIKEEEKIDITCNQDNHRVTVTARELNFIQLYKDIEQGRLPSMRGTHFSSEELADLYDLIIRKLFTFMSVKKGIEDLTLLERLLVWTKECLSTRREQRYFTYIIEKYKNEQA